MLILQTDFFKSRKVAYVNEQNKSNFLKHGYAHFFYFIFLKFQMKRALALLHAVSEWEIVVV